MSVEPKQAGILVPVSQPNTSALQDPEFGNLKNKAEDWLKTGVKSVGREMDSVFFNDDRFELMVDTRGYRPEDLKCTVGSNTIELIAQRQEASAGTQRCMSTSRCYQLPQSVLPEQAICCLSSEGILLIAVPWQK